MVETDGMKVVVDRGGVEEVIERRAFMLCRCGHSANKPFCDGAHKAAEFGEPGAELRFEA